MEKESLTFPEALKNLAERYKVPLPAQQRVRPEVLKLEEKLFKTNELALGYFRKNLVGTPEGKKALEYLSKRGLSDETVQTLKIGYALDAWTALIDFFKSKDVPVSLLEKGGLALPGSRPGEYRDRFRGRIIFPIFSLTGRVVAFGGRTIFDAEPKSDPRVDTHRLDPAAGFKTLTAEIHRVIARAGRGAYYVFDCLSDLAADWYSDMMLGNFFKVTCPYLRELDTIAYFALLRRRHSYRAVAAIRDTTQLLLDVHRHDGTLYVHPLKVFERYSPTMYLPHVWQGDLFRPVTESATISGIYETLTRDSAGREATRFDLWDRTFQAPRADGGRKARSFDIRGT